MNFCDCHCHVTDNHFWRQKNLFFKKWKEKGITKIISMATNLKTSKRNLQLADEKREGIIIALGRHPWGAHKFNEKEKVFYRNYLDDPRVKVIGEIGLDHYFIKEKKYYPLQLQMFEFFLKEAQKNKKPVMLHLTGAEMDTAELLQALELSIPICCHWFSGPEKPLIKLIDLDCYFSINPAVIKSKNHQQVAKMVPENRLLTESDGPVKFQGKKGGPELIPQVCAEIAKLRGKNEEEIQKIIWKNLNNYLIYE
jgi:TatD DNase family protein